MPVVSVFYGIIIRLYFYDKGKHSVAHIDAEYGKFEASFILALIRLFTILTITINKAWKIFT